MDIMFWVWLILAAFLIVTEIFTAGFFLLWFGIAAAATAVVTLLGGGAVLQWITFIGLSIILWAVTRPFARKMRKGEETDTVGANRYLGLKGIITEDVDNALAKGMVRVEREEWRAESAGGKGIPKGTWVEVTQVTGARLIVVPTEPPEGDSPEGQ